MTALDDPVVSFTPAGHIIRSEMAVAGAAMRSAKLAEVLGDIVEPGHFRIPANAIIYAAALALAEQGSPVDPNAVLARITRDGDLANAGGAAHLHDCMAADSTAGDPAWHAREVLHDAERRGAGAALVRALDYVQGETYDPEGGLERVRSMIDAATAPATSGDLQSLDELLAEVLTSLDQEQQRGLSVPLIDLDHLVNGFAPGELIVLAARTGVGKSIAALGMAADAAIRQGVPSVIFTMEMTRHEVMTRLIASEGKVPLWSLLHRELSGQDWDRIDKARELITGAPLIIDDSSYCTLAHIRSRLRGAARTFGSPPGFAVVDYMQLLAGNGKAENRQAEVAGFSRGLKLIAGEFGLPVLAVSQLNRSPEHRKDHRPVMSDLRESGAQEQDASVVILLYRDEYHDRESPRMGEIDYIVAKNRNGPPATVTAAFQGEYARVMDMAPPREGRWEDST